MTGFFQEVLEQEFMLRALTGGALVGVACAMLGVLVFQRGITFAGDGLAHSMFGAAGIMALADVWLVQGSANGMTESSAFLWAALPLNVLVGIVMAWARRLGWFRGDAVIGIFFPIMFAAGVLCLALRRNSGAPPVNIEALLFGSILGMTPTDLLITTIGALAIAVVVLTWGRKIAYATFDSDLALMSGVNVALAEYALFALCAAVVAVSVRVAGVVLVSSLLAIPAGTASLWRGSYGMQLLFASIFASAGVKLGLMASYQWDVPPGAMIVLIMGLMFILATAIKSVVPMHAKR